MSSTAKLAHTNTLWLLLVCLAAASSGTVAQEPAEYAPGKQVEKYLRTSRDSEVGCLLYLPRDYQPNGKKYPMMLFLHGAGESYGLLNKVTKWGPPRLAARGEHFEFILVSPQCQMFDSWDSDRQQARLIALVDCMIKKYGADERRICVSGFSMGGTGAWHLAAKYPKRFASVIPICGDSIPGEADKLKNTAIWAFHGDDDQAVPVKRSIDMVDAVTKAGGANVRLTTLEGIGHNVWSAAYATPELYTWMLQQRLGEPDKSP